MSLPDFTVSGKSQFPTLEELPQPLPYLANFQDFSAVFEPGVYYRIGNQVHVEGVVTRGAATINMAQLPLEYAPQRRVARAAYGDGGAGRVDVTATGLVIAQFGMASIVLGTSYLVFGVTYDLRTV